MENQALSSTPDVDDIRQQAEKKLSLLHKEYQQFQDENIQRLVHELDVHQIELEMQNDELLRTQEELKESRDRFADLFDYAPVGYFIVNDQDTIQEVNLTATMMLGMDREKVLKHHFSHLIIPDDQDIYYFHRKRLSTSKGSDSCEIRLKKGDGSTFNARLESVVAPGIDGGTTIFRIALSDISALKNAEKDLKKYDEIVHKNLLELNSIYQASQRLQAILSSADLAKEIIQMLEETIGYDFGVLMVVEEGTDRLIPFALSAREREQDKGMEEKLRSRGFTLVLGKGITGWVAKNGESVNLGDVHRDGRYFKAHDGIQSELCVPLHANGKIIGVVDVESTRPNAYSLQDQRLLETFAAQIAVAIFNSRLLESLKNNNEQLRALTIQIEHVEEGERNKIARELHDRVGQNLTALNINLNILRTQLTSETAIKIGSRLDDSIHLVEDTMEQIRDVMAVLHPPVLDDYGLVAALRWYGEQLTKRTDIQVEVDDVGDVVTRPPLEDELVLFRVAQEALTNVASHAQARKVSIKVGILGSQVCLTITDDGVGFDPSAVAKTGKQGWGLRTIRERVEAIGGYFQLRTTVGMGTEISVRVPYQANQGDR